MREVKVEFLVNGEKVRLDCEVASSFLEKTKGLMDREFLPRGRGMLFLFCFPWIRFFWMKNVCIPLDIVFVDRHQRVICFYEADVEKGFLYKTYWSRGFCKYVIECNQGFCRKHGVFKGTQVDMGL
ncbi:MAG: DUF192 domain-containing protein [Candidatus Thermoplasmatota archaeon]